MSNITRLNYQNKEIILIGTAHVSQASVEEVRETVIAEKPDTICIELDKSRYDSITSPSRWQELDIIQVIKEKKVSYLLVNLILSSYQSRLAKQVDIESGAEMLEGIKLSEELSATLVLADRDIKTTFMRIYRQLSLWEKCKLLASVILSVFDKTEISQEDIEKLKEQDMLNQALNEISDEFPNIKKVLVDERDRYLAYKIQNAPGKKILAILGAAHTVGIKDLILSPQTIDTLDEIPNRTTLGKIAGWLIPTAILGALIVSFILDPKFGKEQMLGWVLWNGGASVLGCLIMLANPLTILVSFVVAPFTSFIPVLGVGWFAALTEALVTKPQVKDFESMSEDTQTVKGFYKNRVTRILLIFFITGFLSSLASFISGISIFSSLFNNI